MLNLKPSKELFDEAVYKEYRIISRFFDTCEGELFRERFKEIGDKIFITNTATQEELFEVARLIKLHCD